MSAATGACQNTTLKTDSNKYAYVRHLDTNTISQFRVESGLQPLQPETVKVGYAPSSVASDRFGRFVYVVNQGDTTISQFRIGSKGVLLPLNPSTIEIPQGVIRLVIHPNGRFLYAVAGNSSVFQFRISTDGNLVSLIPASVKTGHAPISLAISPSGRWLYVLANNESEIVGHDGSVYGYSISSAGLLTALPGGNTLDKVVMNFPNRVSVTPDSKYAYVTAGRNFGGDWMGQGLILLRIAANGTLQPISSSPSPMATHNTMGQHSSMANHSTVASGSDTVLRMTINAYTDALGHNFYGIASARNGDQNILWHGILGKNGELAVTEKYSITDTGQLVTMDSERTTKNTYINEVVCDTEEHQLYVLNSSTTGNIYRYYLEKSGMIKTRSPNVFAVGTSPGEMILVHRHN